jgi:hypothetical protein
VGPIAKMIEDEEELRQRRVETAATLNAVSRQLHPRLTDLGVSLTCFDPYGPRPFNGARVDNIINSLVS